ncbi:MAG: hypothetical protein U0P48_11465 [Ancrocorticia sp.]
MKIRTLLFGGAIGYVLGARAGRGRYEQIKRVSGKLWNSKPVQSGVSKAKSAAGEATQDLKDRAISAVPFVAGSQYGKRADDPWTEPVIRRDGSDEGTVTVSAVEL